MEKILISACLVGDKTRYDGKSNYNPLIKKLLEKYELVPFCSEVEGGLNVPRLPSEINHSGEVINSKGINVSKYYRLGAEKALNICSYLGIKIAILKDRSPACGVYEIYDGTFSSRPIKGEGITTKYLRKNGIKVISEKDIEDFLNNKIN